MDDLMAGALELMMLGMGVVFTFLTVLVIATSAMSSIMRRVAPDLPAPRAQASPSGPSRGAREGVDPRTRRAVEQAIALYKKRHG